MIITINTVTDNGLKKDRKEILKDVFESIATYYNSSVQKEIFTKEVEPVSLWTFKTLVQQGLKRLERLLRASNPYVAYVIVRADWKSKVDLGVLTGDIMVLLIVKMGYGV